MIPDPEFWQKANRYANGKPTTAMSTHWDPLDKTGFEKLRGRAQCPMVNAFLYRTILKTPVLHTGRLQTPSRKRKVARKILPDTVSCARGSQGCFWSYRSTVTVSKGCRVTGDLLGSYILNIMISYIVWKGTDDIGTWRVCRWLLSTVTKPLVQKRLVRNFRNWNAHRKVQQTTC